MRPKRGLQGIVLVSALLGSACGGGGNESASPAAPTPAPAPQVQFSCTVSGVVQAESPAATLVTFNEPEIATTWTETNSEGSYASCTLRHSRDLTQFSVKDVSLQGNYLFRNLWSGCTSSNASVWDGGVLQSRDSMVSIGVGSSPKPATIRFSVGVDGTFPDSRFELLVTDDTGAITSTTFSMSLGRVSLTCTKPVSVLRIIHNGPNWIIDSIAF